MDNFTIYVLGIMFFQLVLMLISICKVNKDNIHLRTVAAQVENINRHICNLNKRMIAQEMKGPHDKVIHLTEEEIIANEN